MRIIRHMIRKEFKQIFRTREMIGVIFGVPIIQLVVLGFTITNEVKHIRLMIVDQDNSALSRDIARSFAQTDRFDIVDSDADIHDVIPALDGWKSQMALVIPPDFSNDLRRRAVPDIQLLIDGIDGNTAGVALGYAQGILARFAREQMMPGLHGTRINLVSLEERMWYNIDLDNAQFMIPGIVVVLLTVISMMLSAVNLVREKEIGTLEQLMVTPLKRYQLLIGKITPFLILTFVELIIVMTLAGFIFSIKYQGSLLLLGILALLFLFTTLGLGVFISTITGTQQEAMFISWFIMVFMLLMSGFFIPIENMPTILQNLTYLNPMRYFLYIIRDITQKGATIQYLMKDLIPMTVYGLVIFTLAVLNFHKRIS